MFSYSLGKAHIGSFDEENWPMVGGFPQRRVMPSLSEIGSQLELSQSCRRRGRRAPPVGDEVTTPE